MDAIGDGVDRYLVGINARPEELPHLARDSAVQLAHAIMLSGQVKRQHRHAIGWTPAMIFACHLHKLFARQAELAPIGAKILVHQVVAKGIVACWYRSVRGEERVGGDRLARLD